MKNLEDSQITRKVGIFELRTANECMEEAHAQPTPRKLYHNLLFEGEIALLFADTGVGKSVFAVQMANEISKTDKVLYVDLELSEKQFQLRYTDEYGNMFAFNNNLYRVSFARPFHVPDGVDYNTFFLESVEKLVEKTGAKIIIIDNMTKLVSTDTDMAKVAKPLMDALNNLKFEHNLTLLLLEHTRKTDYSRVIILNDLQGSKMKVNFADAVFSIGLSEEGKSIRYIKQLKCRSAEIMFDKNNVPVYEIVKKNSFLQFDFLRYSTEYCHLKQISEDDRKQRIEKAKEMKAQGIPNTAIAEEFKVTEGAVRKWLEK